MCVLAVLGAALCIFIAGVTGGVTLEGAHPQAEARSEQNQPAQVQQNLTRSAQVVGGDIGVNKDAGCKDRKDDRGSDLCAQWGSVDANRSNATATWAAAFFSFLGIVLIVLTFAHGVRTSRRQLRAYVVTRGIKLQKFDVGEPIKARITFVNCGQTPALDVSSCFVPEYGPVGATPKQPMPAAQAFGTLGAGVKGYGLILDNTPLTQEIADRIVSGTHQLIIRGEITYRDIFRRKRVTEYRYKLAVGGGHDQNFEVAFAVDGKGRTT